MPEPEFEFVTADDRVLPGKVAGLVSDAYMGEGPSHEGPWTFLFTL